MNDISERSITPKAKEDDKGFELSVRPRSFEEFVGQDKIKENLKIFIQATKQRGEPLDHVLFCGPPGLGKTTLAHIIASELGVEIKVTSGPVLERPGDLAAILTNISEKAIFFIDEIHRLPRIAEEILYPAMEEYQLDIIIGQGPSARTLKLNPVVFEWKADKRISEGFIAHEAQEIFADAVNGEKDGEKMQSMDYGRITPLLVKAIQEQQTLIDNLKTRIEALEG